MSTRSMEGLGPAPEANYLHVELGKVEETGQVFPWHFYDHDSDRQTPVFEPALTGRLEEVRLKKGVYKNKENFKVLFKIISGRTVWFIRTGIETTFARGVLLALNQAKDALGDKPELTFYAKPGDTAVYGSVYYADTMEYIHRDWDENVKLLPIIQEIQELMGQEVQTLDSVRADYDARQTR